jgi:hypothetical protein
MVQADAAKRLGLFVNPLAVNNGQDRSFKMGSARLL